MGWVKNTLATNPSVLSKASKQKASCRSNALQKICLGGTNASCAARLGCLGSSAHTRMSWLLPGHSNGSCLHWTGLNSRPSWPPLHAICGMAAAETLKGGSKQAWRLRCCYLFSPRLRVVHSCAAGSAYDLLQRLVFSQAQERGRTPRNNFTSLTVRVAAATRAKWCKYALQLGGVCPTFLPPPALVHLSSWGCGIKNGWLLSATGIYLCGTLWWKSLAGLYFMQTQLQLTGPIPTAPLPPLAPLPRRLPE